MVILFLVNEGDFVFVDSIFVVVFVIFFIVMCIFFVFIICLFWSRGKKLFIMEVDDSMYVMNIMYILSF